jgi:hypothetical protein
MAEIDSSQDCIVVKDWMVDAQGDGFLHDEDFGKGLGPLGGGVFNDSRLPESGLVISSYFLSSLGLLPAIDFPFF